MIEAGQKDFLTNCYTKEELINFLRKISYNAELQRKSFALAVIDLDHFKRLNDKYGHKFGDSTLKYVASTIHLTLEGKAVVFRYGGDEFVALFVDKTSREAAPLLRRCNRNIVNRPFLFEGNLYKVTASCGVATFPKDGKTKDELFKKADEAMYVSKRYGGNLTTEAGRIKYIKARNKIALVAGIAGIAFSLFILNHFIYKEFIQRTVEKIGSIRIVTEKKSTDSVVLKNGDVFTGRILRETDTLVSINFIVKGGHATVTLDKSEIEEIKYNPDNK